MAENADGQAPVTGAKKAVETVVVEKTAQAPAVAKATVAAPIKVVALSEEELARAWPCFRGRGGSGISPYTNVPDEWDGPSGKNIVWKSPVPLGGNSSPVVVAGRIFLTGGDENRRQVFCFEAKGGKLLWQRDVPSTPASRNGQGQRGYGLCGVHDGQRRPLCCRDLRQRRRGGL